MIYTLPETAAEHQTQKTVINIYIQSTQKPTKPTRN
jgi:hypothetical protein